MGIKKYYDKLSSGKPSTQILRALFLWLVVPLGGWAAGVWLLKKFYNKIVRGKPFFPPEQ